MLKPWRTLHERLAQEATAYVPTGHEQLLLLGDSLFEQWRATTYGVYNSENADKYANVTLIAEIFHKHWGNPLISAISSDQTQHLLWRLRNGGLGTSQARDPYLAIALLIGTNNLRRDGPLVTATAIITIVHDLLKHTSATWIVVLGLLPRSDGEKFDGMARLRSLCPSCLSACCSTWNGTKVPGAAPSVMSDVREVNEQLQRAVSHLQEDAARQGRIVAYADCGKGRLASRTGSGGLEASLRADDVHPNPDGHVILARCVEHALTEVASGQRQGHPHPHRVRV